MDEFSQPFPDYDHPPGAHVGRKRSGRRTKEQEAARKKARRARNPSKYRDYMKRYMAARRAAQKGSTPDE